MRTKLTDLYLVSHDGNGTCKEGEYHRYTYMVMHVGVTTTVRFEIEIVLSPTCIYRQHTVLSSVLSGARPSEDNIEHIIQLCQ